MTQETSRYSLVMRFLAGAGAAGIMLLLFSPEGSDFRTAGGLLLIGWIPVLMHVAELLVAHFRRKPVQKSAFDGAGPFLRHASLRVSPTSDGEPLPTFTNPSSSSVEAILIKAKDGFSVRLQAIAPATDGTALFDVQFKSPELALAKLGPSDELALRVGRSHYPAKLQ
jgi:hypothetical protein